MRELCFEYIFTDPFKGIFKIRDSVMHGPVSPLLMITTGD